MRIEFSPQAERNLQSIFVHLFQPHTAFGRSVREARDLAAARVRAVKASTDRIARAAGIGTVHPEVAARFRQVTFDRAIFWFEVLEAKGVVRIIAVYFGGQNHIERLMCRLSGESPPRS